MEPNDSQSNDQADSQREFPQTRVLKSEDLLHGEKEILIAHRGELYRLRETRNGKLLLGK